MHKINQLTALLAFAAIMIVLTTLATVVVEALNKLLRKRSSDFEHLLTRLYDDVIKPDVLDALKQTGKTEAEEATKKLEGIDFASQLVRNPAFDPTRKKWFQKLPFVKNLFSTSFEQLTTRQFVEQFAETEIGQRLIEAGDQAAKGIVCNLSYQFERYGEAASDYFKRRAGVLSVFVALGLAIALNIDAVRLYNALVQDDDLTTQVIANIDVARLEGAFAEAPENGSPGGEGSPSAEVQAVLDEIKRESRNLQALGLPIGTNYFPYCLGDGEVDDVSSEEIDGRCKNLPPASQFKVAIPLLGGVISSIGQYLADTYNRLTTRNGAAWIFLVLLSGGLIGLGAPFWFKTYQFIADYVPGIKRPDGTLSRQPRSGKTTQATVVEAIQPDISAPPSIAYPMFNVAPVGTYGDRFVTKELPGIETVEVEVASDLGLPDNELYQAFARSARPRGPE